MDNLGQISSHVLYIGSRIYRGIRRARLGRRTRALRLIRQRRFAKVVQHVQDVDSHVKSALSEDSMSKRLVWA